MAMEPRENNQSTRIGQLHHLVRHTVQWVHWV